MHPRSIMAENFKSFYNEHIDSTRRYISNIESIIEKYSKENDDTADSICLQTLKIKQNRGHIENFTPVCFGKSKLLYKGRRDQFRSFVSESGYNRSPVSETFEKSAETDSGVCEKQTDGTYSISEHEKSFAALHETFMQVIKSDYKLYEPGDVESLSSHSSTDSDYDCEDANSWSDGETSEAEEEIVSESALQSETIDSESTANSVNSRSKKEQKKSEPCPELDKFSVEKVKDWLQTLPKVSQSLTDSQNAKQHLQNSGHSICSESLKNFRKKHTKKATNLNDDCMSEFSPKSRYRNRSIPLGETFVVENAATKTENRHKTFDSTGRHTVSFDSLVSEDSFGITSNNRQQNDQTSQTRLICVKSPVTKYIGFSRDVKYDENRQTMMSQSVPVKPVFCQEKFNVRKCTEKPKEQQALSECSWQSDREDENKRYLNSDKQRNYEKQTSDFKLSLNDRFSNRNVLLQSSSNENEYNDTSQNILFNNTRHKQMFPKRQCGGSDFNVLKPCSFFMNKTGQNLMMKCRYQHSQNAGTCISSLDSGIKSSEAISPLTYQSPTKNATLPSKHQEILRLKRKVKPMTMETFETRDIKSPSSSFRQLSLNSPSYIQSPNKKPRRDSDCSVQSSKLQTQLTFNHGLFTEDQIIVNPTENIALNSVNGSARTCNLESTCKESDDLISQSGDRSTDMCPVSQCKTGLSDLCVTSSGAKRKKCRSFTSNVDNIVNKHAACREASKSDFELSGHLVKNNSNRKSKLEVYEHINDGNFNTEKHIDKQQQKQLVKCSSSSAVCKLENKYEQERGEFINMKSTKRNQISNSEKAGSKNALIEESNQFNFKIPQSRPDVLSHKSRCSQNVNRGRTPALTIHHTEMKSAPKKCVKKNCPKLNFDSTLPTKCQKNKHSKTSTPEKKNHVFRLSETLSTICTEESLIDSGSSDEDAVIFIH